MTTPTATPATGLIADNVIGFARALRARRDFRSAPGAVIDALKGAAGHRYRQTAPMSSPRWRAIFVKRHEHALIFARAFDLFFRAAEDWKHMLDSVPLPEHARKKPPPASRRVQEALAHPHMTRNAAGPGAGAPPLGVRPGKCCRKKGFSRK